MDWPAARESKHQPAGERSVVGVVCYRRPIGDDRLHVTFSNPALKHALDGMAREDQPFTFQSPNPSACPGSIFPVCATGATIQGYHSALVFSEFVCVGLECAPGELAMDRVRERYSWEAVTDAYEKLLRGLRLE
jgi:hypothetical protein